MKRPDLSQINFYQLHVVEGLSTYKIAEQVGCCEDAVHKRCVNGGFFRKGQCLRHKTILGKRQLLRQQHEFTKEVKQSRFHEEHGYCQYCREIIGDGKDWRDKGPGALVTYHHIKMICEGGTGDPQNCMVLHKQCHGGSKNGSPLNPELHNGRKFSYRYATSVELCLWCGFLGVVRAFHICHRCAKPLRLPKKTICPTCATQFFPSAQVVFKRPMGPWYCSKSCASRIKRS